MAAKKDGDSGQPMQGSQQQAGQSQNENDPVAVLEKQGCSVFLPGT